MKRRDSSRRLHRLILRHSGWICLLVGFLVPFGCSDLAGTSQGKGGNGPKAESAQAKVSDFPKVATSKAIRKEIVQKTEQPAQVDAFATTPIHAKVSGYVDRLCVDIGDRVRGPKRDDRGIIIEPGQLLAQLTAPEWINELQEKRALIDQAKADIEQAKAAILVAESLVASADANVAASYAAQKRADAMYDKWKSEADRMGALAASKTVTSKVAEEAEQQSRAADATRAESLAYTKAMEAKKREAIVAVAKAKADLQSIEARHAVAEAEFMRVQSLCEYLEIRAPFDGIVSQRNIDQGFLVHAAHARDDQPLFVIVQSDRVRVFVEVPEGDAIHMEVGRKAMMKVPALGQQVFEGTVARTGWALQAGTRTLRCEVDFENPQGVLRPGMYANVEVIVAQKKEVLTLPKGSLLPNENPPACWILQPDGKIVKRGLKIGIRSSAEVEILEGLDGSEEIIIANVGSFREGQTAEKAIK